MIKLQKHHGIKNHIINTFQEKGINYFSFKMQKNKKSHKKIKYISLNVDINICFILRIYLMLM